MLLQATNGKKTPLAWGSAGKFLAGLAACVASLVTALVALQESRTKAPETTSKAAHSELVSKLQALNADMTAMEKRFTERAVGLQQDVKFGVAESKAQADSVKALFTGYALAARRDATPAKTIELIKGVVKESQEKAEEVAKAAHTPEKPRRHTRSFRKPTSWDNIDRQAKRLE